MKPGSPTVLYEDSHLIAVEKPAGIHTAPLHDDETDTLLGFIVARFPEVAHVDGMKKVERGLLHRLDRETSGIVIAARTSEAFRRLRDAFARGLAVKEYKAICVIPGGGMESGSRVRIESRFVPYGPGRKKVRVLPMEDGAAGANREATKATYLTEVLIEREKGKVILASARITKGFRHQVRAHLAFLGLPILGDPLYGAPAPPDAVPRMYLHAALVELPHPETGELLRIQSPMPACFEDFFV